MHRIVLMIGNDENGRLLGEWLSASPEYEVVSSDGGVDSMDRADLCILDSAGFAAHGADLRVGRENDPGAFLPRLLVVRETERRTLPSSVWASVDDVVTIPVKKRELECRIENALERRRLTRELEESETRFRSLFELLPDPVVILDEDGCVTNANQEFCSLTGYAKSELLSRSIETVETFSWPLFDDRTRASEPARDASVPDVLRYTTEAGDTGFVTHTVATLEREETTAETMHLLHDVTDHVLREQELTRFREAVEHAGHSVYITDADGNITYVNPAFEEQTGYEKPEVLGRNPNLLKSGEHGDEFYAALWETILAGETWENEVVNRRKSGERYRVNQTVAPIVTDDGAVEGFVAVNTDVTEKKRRAQQITVLNRVLRHNLRNELTVGLGYMNRLLDALEDTDERTTAENVYESLEGLAEISEKVGRFETITDDSESHETADLERLLAGVCTRAHRAHPDATIDVDQPDEATFAVSTLLETALQELLENAIEHNPGDAPEVRISVTGPGGDSDGICIEIEDDGPGIPRDEREVVREGDETPLLHASGLGLWLSYWSVQMSGGTVTIVDDEPVGTRVVLEVPELSLENTTTERTHPNDD